MITALRRRGKPLAAHFQHSEQIAANPGSDPIRSSVSFLDGSQESEGISHCRCQSQDQLSPQEEIPGISGPQATAE
jgi:hypothetical protein